MITVLYKPTFVRQFKKLEPALQEETLEKIEQFKDRENHQRLKVHKLTGKLADRWSFSVNYRYRIVFSWKTKSKAVFLAIGDHDVYK